MNTYVRHSAQTGLSDSDIIDMRVRAQRDSLTATQIGVMYGIDRTTAARIISGRTWAHVPSPKQFGTNYTIYPDGRIFSKAAARFMNVTVGKDGLEYVELRSNGTRNKVAVAALVAAMFIKPKAKKAKIGFANGNPTDSHFTNLVIK